jgi:ABC-2 type transport system permease protein
VNLWRLEWLRLARTRRLLAIIAVYLLFGLIGPVTARYLNDILSRSTAAGVIIKLPPPTPAAGIAQFVTNAAQIGLLVVVLVAASALTFDARREMAVFLRTRVDSVARIVLPAYVVNTLAAIVGLVVGTAGAWYETAVLIGGLPIGAMLAGLGYGALFLVFAVALVAAVGSLVRGMAGAAGLSLVILLALAVLSGLGSLGHWIPTGLSGAMTAVLTGTSLTAYLPAAGIAVAASALLLWVAVAASARREL